MYNLLIGRISGSLPAGRLLEYTDSFASSYVAPNGTTVDIFRLVNLPTLLMPELQDTQSPQVARVGDIRDLTLVGNDYRFRFVPNPAVPAIASDKIAEASLALQIDKPMEFNRTHWAVKNVDLYRVIQESILASMWTSLIFRLPTEVPVERDLVAVMMPFAAGFDNVYTALQEAAIESGMRCNRADDIWVNNHIMDDVINLIWRARVVISDMTSRNPNVFYETGIVHTLGRNAIQITQSMSDIPFDLQSIRSIPYLNNREGLEDLKARVVARIRELTTLELARAN